MRAILLSLLLLWSSEAFGQTYKITVDVQSCSVLACKRITQVGSAACIGKIGRECIFVSAGHCFWNLDDPLFNASTKPLSVKIEGVDGVQIPARVIAFSDHVSPNDLAYIGVDESKIDGEKVFALPLAEKEPPAGSDVKIEGFPSGAKFNVLNGTVQRVALNSVVHTGPLDPGRPTGDLFIIPATVGGNSGSPVIFNGQLVGVISNTGSGHSVASGVTRIRASLIRVFKRLPEVGTAPAKPKDDPGISARQITSDDIWPQRRDKIYVMAFGAEWCGPCKEMKPVLDKLDAEGSAAVVYYDVDQSPDMVQKHGIKSIPAYIAFDSNNHDAGATLSGVVPIERLRELVNKVRRKGKAAVNRLPIVTDPDCARPKPPVIEQPPAPEKPPEADPPPPVVAQPPAIGPKGDKGDPGAQGAAGKDGAKGDKGDPGTAGKDCDSKVLAELLAVIALFPVDPETKKPAIPVELYDETTGSLIDRRLVPLGDAIQLGNRSKKVK